MIRISLSKLCAEPTPEEAASAEENLREWAESEALMGRCTENHTDLGEDGCDACGYGSK